MKKKLIYTCSMCSHFDSNRGVCKLDYQPRIAYSSEFASACKEEGRFVRYIHVLPDTYNYYSLEKEAPVKWDYDYTNVPKDENGIPLIVKTKRGIERALPANSSVTLKGDILLGVPRILTYQGHREAIYELGVDLARIEAEKQGVELTVLPEEDGPIGQVVFMLEYHVREKQRLENQKNYWLSASSVEEW
jgi:hypothetical protein